MQVLLDQNPCDVQATTVGEAVDAAAALARDQGRMIVEISVDGVTWPETHLASPQQLGAAAEVVALTTAEPATLVRQVFSDAAEALADADTLQREAAESLQADEQIVAMDKLNEAMCATSRSRCRASGWTSSSRWSATPWRTGTRSGSPTRCCTSSPRWSRNGGVCSIV